MKTNKQKALNNIIATNRIEGYALSPKTIERCRGILAGKLDGDVELSKLIKQHSKEKVKQRD